MQCFHKNITSIARKLNSIRSLVHVHPYYSNIQNTMNGWINSHALLQLVWD
jgi:hypothetical protein